MEQALSGIVSNVGYLKKESILLPGNPLSPYPSMDLPGIWILLKKGLSVRK
jgi:hypothetical protein